MLRSGEGGKGAWPGAERELCVLEIDYLVSRQLVTALSSRGQCSLVATRTVRALKRDSLFVYKVFLVRGTSQRIHFIDTQSITLTATRKGIRT